MSNKSIKEQEAEAYVSLQPVEYDEEPLRTAKVVFSYPLQWNAQVWTEITMTEPRVSDQLAVEEAGQSQGRFEARLMARISGLPYEALKTMRSCDYAKLLKVFQTFTRGPASS